MIQRDFASLVGSGVWAARIDDLRGQIDPGTRAGRLVTQRFAACLAYEKFRQGQPLSAPEAAFAGLVNEIVALHCELRPAGQDRLLETLAGCLAGDFNLMPVLHLLHTARQHRALGFQVNFSGLEQGAAFDLLISREGEQAEIVCDTMSAEDGHAVNRGAWMQLVDGIDPDLQTWLAAHPGRYLLKMTLPGGLKPAAPEQLPALQARIRTMLKNANRADYDEAAMLRLDPLLLAGAQALDGKKGETGVMAKLRREYGPEAHLAATASGSSVFVLAARAGAENDVALAVRRRMSALAPARLAGDRPGILNILIEDTDALEWRTLREQHVLESEMRYFLTLPEAAPVVAVNCASRFALAGAEAGEVRFRNPSHAAAKSIGLGPAVVSTV